MVLKDDKDKQVIRKRKSRRESLLNLTIILLILWLLGCLTLAFFYMKNQENINLELKKSDSAEKEEGKIYFELLDFSEETAVSSARTDADSEVLPDQQTRDEFQPSMESLFKERKLTRENIEPLFENRRNSDEVNPMHSTFGKDVVYIYHSHSREAFLPYFKNAVQPEEAYHAKANITLVGKMLGNALERRGMGTEVDTSDIVEELDARGMDYGGSYPVSREHVQAAQKENKDLEIFLDVHRDSLRKDSTTTRIKGKDYARLLFVVGTGHRDFEKNLAFTEGLHALLDSRNPGISKGILEKDRSQGNGIYNQDLSPNSVIVEIGGVDNTAEEISLTVEALANALSDNYWHGER